MIEIQDVPDIVLKTGLIINNVHLWDIFVSVLKKRRNNLINI